MGTPTPENLEQLKKLSPFALRAQVAETGRQRLLQHRNKLEFLLLTNDLSENSRDEALKEFACPIFQALESADILELFHLQGTKILGFRRNPLSTQIQKCLRGCRIAAKDLRVAALPANPHVVLFGAGSAAQQHAKVWKELGATIDGIVELPEKLAKSAQLFRELLGCNVEVTDHPEELLDEKQPDCVDVCLPTELHCAGCELALRKGYHTLCVQPFLDPEKQTQKHRRKKISEISALAARHKRVLALAQTEEDLQAFAKGKPTLIAADLLREEEEKKKEYT